MIFTINEYRFQFLIFWVLHTLGIGPSNWKSSIWRKQHFHYSSFAFWVLGKVVMERMTFREEFKEISLSLSQSCIGHGHWERATVKMLQLILLWLCTVKCSARPHSWKIWRVTCYCFNNLKVVRTLSTIDHNDEGTLAKQSIRTRKILLHFLFKFCIMIHDISGF